MSPVLARGITIPRGLPDESPRTSYKYVAGARRHLFLVGEQAGTADLLCYEPATDTWFGPLSLDGIGDIPYPLGTARGVWVGGPDGLAYVALRWYRRLSAMEADPSAVYTGLYGEFRIHYTLKRWDEAIAAGERLLEEIPHLYAGMTPQVERFLEYAREHRSEIAK